MEDQREKAINFILVKRVFSASGLLKNDVKSVEFWLKDKALSRVKLEVAVCRLAVLTFGEELLSLFSIASYFADIIVVGDKVWLPGLTGKLPRQWPRWRKA